MRKGYDSHNEHSLDNTKFRPFVNRVKIDPIWQRKASIPESQLRSRAREKLENDRPPGFATASRPRRRKYVLVPETFGSDSVPCESGAANVISCERGRQNTFAFLFSGFWDTLGEFATTTCSTPDYRGDLFSGRIESQNIHRFEDRTHAHRRTSHSRAPRISFTTFRPLHRPVALAFLPKPAGTS
jgi:hypothetical protein